MPGKALEEPSKGFNGLRRVGGDGMLKNTQKFEVGEDKFLDDSYVTPQNPKMENFLSTTVAPWGKIPQFRSRVKFLMSSMSLLNPPPFRNLCP